MSVEIDLFQLAPKQNSLLLKYMNTLSMLYWLAAAIGKVLMNFLFGTSYNLTIGRAYWRQLDELTLHFAGQRSASYERCSDRKKGRRSTTWTIVSSYTSVDQGPISAVEVFTASG